MVVQNDSVVTIAYTLTDEAGVVIDSSKEHGDLAYLHGHQNIIPGLEEALEGKEPGENLTVTVPPAKGYGDRDDQAVFEVPRDRLPADAELELGMQFQAQDGNGQSRIVTLTNIEDDTVMLDGNHPLAGQTLNFDVEVRDVREATEEERDHGHVHGPDTDH